MNPFNYGSYLNNTMRRESGGRADAKNPRSSASGLFQFIDPTYLSYARRMFPGMDDRSLLAKKNDPTIQNQVMEQFTNDNVGILQKAGIPINNGSVYAAHFLGPQGATRALGADPNTPITDVVDAKAIAANPEVFKNIRTVADFQNWTAGHTGNGGTAVAENPADLPAPGAIPAQQPGIENAPGNFLGKLAGAFGIDKGSWSAADALQGAGIAMMARDNPQGAAAMAQALRYTKDQAANKTEKKQNQVVKYDAKTGNAVVYDPNTQTWKTQQVTTPEPRTLDNKGRQLLTDYWDRTQQNAEVLDRTAAFKQQIMDGDLSVDVLSRVGKTWRDIVNDPTHKDINAARFFQWVESARNSILQDAKGVQTEGDAIRALNALLPGTGKYSDKAVLANLEDFYKAKRGTFDRYSKYTADLLKTSPGEDGAFYNDQINQSRTRFDEFSKSYGTKKQEYEKRNPNAGQPRENPAPVTGQVQTQQQQFREGQTAINPKTKQRMIFRNGNWENL